MTGTLATFARRAAAALAIPVLALALAAPAARAEEKVLRAVQIGRAHV